MRQSITMLILMIFILGGCNDKEVKELSQDILDLQAEVGVLQTDMSGMNCDLEDFSFKFDSLENAFSKCCSTESKKKVKSIKTNSSKSISDTTAVDIAVADTTVIPEKTVKDMKDCKCREFADLILKSNLEQSKKK